MGGIEEVRVGRGLYPAQWQEMAWACKERAGWCCEACGVAHGEWVLSARGEPYEVRLAAAHLDHDPWNPDARLRALCQACHLRYDASWQQRQRRVEMERLRHQAWLNYQVYGWFGR